MDGASAQPPSLTPLLSIEQGAPLLFSGEYVPLRIPDIRLDGMLDTETETAAGLPPTSNGSTAQRFAIVRTASEQSGHFELEVYPVLSFSALVTQASYANTSAFHRTAYCGRLAK